MRIFIVCLFLAGVVSCKSEKTRPSIGFSKVTIQNLKQDSLLNIRAIEVKDGKVWYAGSKGFYGYEYIEDNSLLSHQSRILTSDSTNLEFRAIAKTDQSFFVLSAGYPAQLYKIQKDVTSMVYTENDPKVFYDAMAFWNNQEGIAIGDPTEDCMSIIITRNGGNTWQKLPCSELPKAEDGEAAFAASNSNISIVGLHTWVATGGKVSRVLYSPDKGKTWTIFSAPIVQGKSTTGMYAIDFYDDRNGFAIGGDYTKPNDTLANKIRTNDGGKTWQIVADGKAPGYRSCVQYAPNSDRSALVAVGFKGIDYSNDAGNSWMHLSDEGFYTIRFVNDSTAIAAGKGRVSKLIFR